MRSHEFVQEIERISPGAYSGGKSYLTDKQTGKQIKKLPGGSGLLYSVSEGRYGGIDIKRWDPNGADYVAQKSAGAEPKPVKRRGEDSWQFSRRLRLWQERQQGLTSPGQLIGKLSVETDTSGFPLRRAVQVSTITVDEDYRGVGIAKALYGIVLTILKRPLLAGTSQTPGGRRNWVSLASIPGVEMKGWLALDETEFDASERGWRNTPAKVNKTIDTIMGELGGQHIGKNSYGTDYFAFDVKPNTTGTELEAAVKTKLSQVYSSNYNSNAGLYAVWTG